MQENAWDDVIEVPRVDPLAGKRARQKNRRGRAWTAAGAVVLLGAGAALAIWLPDRMGTALVCGLAGLCFAAAVPLGMRKERRHG